MGMCDESPCVVCVCLLVVRACVLLPQLFGGSNVEEEIVGGKCSSSSSLINVTCYAKEIQKLFQPCVAVQQQTDCCA